MKNLGIIFVLTILIGCSSELKRCIDANTLDQNMYENYDMDKYSKYFIKSEMCNYIEDKYKGWDSSECKANELLEARYDKFGPIERKSTLTENEYSNQLDIALCFLDEIDKISDELFEINWNASDININQIEKKYTRLLDNAAKNCNRKFSVDKKKAEARCNFQGIY